MELFYCSFSRFSVAVFDSKEPFSHSNFFMAFFEYTGMDTGLIRTLNLERMFIQRLPIMIGL